MRFSDWSSVVFFSDLRRAVRKVAAFSKAHAQHFVAGFQHRHIDALIGLRARIGLHIGRLGTEEFLQAIDSQLLDDVHVFATAVITLARITFGILVGKLCALRSEEHTSELQSLMRISYAVFCLKKKTK